MTIVEPFATRTSNDPGMKAEVDRGVVDAEQPTDAEERLLWVLLYRIWPQVVDAMVLVRPARASGSIGDGDHVVRDGPGSARTSVI
jgi:hypothetical protein